MVLVLLAGICVDAVGAPYGPAPDSPALDDRLQEATLRVDYIFSGTDKECRIAVDELNRLEGWAGRRRRM